MTTAYLKEIIRSIRFTFGRFLAIAIISFLGAGVFAGLRMSAPDMLLSADSFFKDTNFYDLAVATDKGLDSQVVERIKGTPGVKATMETKKLEALVSTGGAPFASVIETVPKEIANAAGAAGNSSGLLNMPVLMEGRWPKAADECVAGLPAAESMGVSIGGTVSVEKVGGDLEDPLVNNELKVVGLVNSSSYLATKFMGSSNLGGSGKIQEFFYVLPDAFAEDFPVTMVYLAAEGAKDQAWGSAKYDDLVADVKSALEADASTIAKLRLDSIRADAQKKLEDAKDDFEAEKADAQKELEDAARKIATSTKELQDAKNKLDSSKAELDQSLKTLEDTKATLEAKEKELAPLAAMVAGGSQAPLPATGAAVDAATAAAAQQAAAQQAAAMAAQYDSARSQLDAGWQQYNEGKARYDEGLKQREEGLRSYEDGARKLEDAKAELAKNQRVADEEFAKAQQEIDDAQKEIDDIELPEVFVLDRSKNFGAASLDNEAEGIALIATFIPIMFFLVAALVVLTSMARMVDEERLSIGTHKALGYGKVAISLKYVIYGALASGVGSLAGVLALGSFLPQFIVGSYGWYYSFPSYETPIDVDTALIAVFATVAVALASTLCAAWASLREKPAALLLPKAPKPGKRIILERIGPLWRAFSFSQKVTARNLLRYKQRFFMAVIGVAGCTALLMIGFGLRDAIGSIVDNQYLNLETTDAEVTLNADASDDEIDQALSAIRDNSVAETRVSTEFMLAPSPKEDLQVEVLVPQDMSAYRNFFDLRDRKTHKPLTAANGEVLISEKTAQALGVAKGDSFELFEINSAGDKSGTPLKMTVGAIIENYTGHLVVVDASAYESAKGEAPDFNRVLVKLPSSENGGAASTEDENALKQALVDLPGVSTVSLTSEDITTYEDLLGILNSLIVVVVTLAAVLAFVVLYNLTNININERVREIATLKVLGFTRKEVDGYIFREIIIMVFIGAIVGCIGGGPLALAITEAVETSNIMFGRVIEPFSYGASFAITIGFAFIVAFAMQFKLARINMVESLKSVE